MIKDKIVTYVILFLIILLVGLGIWGYLTYKELQDTKIALGIVEDINMQNQRYWEEKLVQKEDSVQVLSGLVINLNKEKDLLNKKWITQVTSLQLQIQNLLIKDTATSFDGIDDMGEFLKVNFSGKKSIVNYEGFTKHYFKLHTSNYELSLSFDPILVRLELMRDEDRIWRIKIFSLTPGILLLTDYNIDSTFYTMVEGGKLLNEEESTPFGLRMKVGLIGSWEREEWKNEHTFELSLELYYKNYYVSYLPLQKSMGVGLYYDLSFSKLIRKIF